MIDLPSAKKIGEMLAALGEPTRMRLIEQLTSGPQYVGDLAKALNIPLVNVSHHLGVLRNAGLLADFRQGRRVSYSLNQLVFTPSDSQDSFGLLHIGPYKLTIRRQPTDAKGKKNRMPE